MKQKLLLKKVFLIFLFSLLKNNVSASGIFSAEKSREDSIGERSFILSLDYGTDREYRGTRDSTQGYIAPDLFYQAPSGFFTSLVVYKTSNASRSGERDFTLGWDFKSGKHYDSEVSYVHYFTAKTDSQLRASLGNTMEYSIRRDYKIISPKLFVDYSFGGNAPSDFNISLQLIHDFEFENVFKHDDDLLIKPYISATMGTLNYLKRKTDTKGKKIVYNTKFDFSAVEISLPIEYYIGRFVITTSLTHTIPYNQPKYIGNNPITYFTFSLGFYII